MENEVMEIKGSNFKGISKKEVALKLVKLFGLFNPAIYKAFTEEDLRNEIMAIEIMLSKIDNETVAEMIERAIGSYPQKRMEDKKLVFDINYIMEFYKEAFDYVHCERFELPLGAKRLTSHYDEKTGIIEQRWQSKTGEIVDIKCFAMLMPESKRPYSKMDEAQIWTDLDSLVL